MNRRSRIRRLMDMGRLLEASGLVEQFPEEEADGLLAVLAALAEVLGEGAHGARSTGADARTHGDAIAALEAVRRLKLRLQRTP